MKPILAKLFMLLLVMTTSCHDSLPVEQTGPGDLHYTNDLSQAQTWLAGNWKLTALTTMIPNPSVPNVQLVVAINQLTLIQVSKLTDQVSFELTKMAFGFQLKTDARPREDNWYVRNPGLQVSGNRLVKTTGGSESRTFRLRRVE